MTWAHKISSGHIKFPSVCHWAHENVLNVNLCIWYLNIGLHIYGLWPLWQDLQSYFTKAEYWWKHGNVNNIKNWDKMYIPMSTPFPLSEFSCCMFNFSPPTVAPFQHYISGILLLHFLQQQKTCGFSMWGIQFFMPYLFQCCRKIVGPSTWLSRDLLCLEMSIILVGPIVRQSANWPDRFVAMATTS